MKLLRLAPENTSFPFMRFRRVSYPFSALLSLIAVALFIFKGMNFGIDFAGGTVIELRAKGGIAEIGTLRALGEKLNLGEIEVHGFGNPADATLRNKELLKACAILSALNMICVEWKLLVRAYQMNWCNQERSALCSQFLPC